MSRTLAILVVLCSGCAQFSTNQTDVTTTAPDGTETRTITTRASGRTFAASRQALATWKATQTDKSQGASVGGLNQEADASELTKALGEGVAKALLQSLKP